MEAFEFDRDTAVELIGDGRWAGAVAPGWSIGSAPNGGYLLAIALRAVAGALPHPDPVAATGYYLSRCQVGPAEVSVEPLRLGRAHSTATARLIQSGETRLHV